MKRNAEAGSVVVGSIDGPSRIEVRRDTRYWKPYEVFVNEVSVGRFDSLLEISWYFENRAADESDDFVGDAVDDDELDDDDLDDDEADEEFDTELESRFDYLVGVGEMAAESAALADAIREAEEDDPEDDDVRYYREMMEEGRAQ